MSDLYWNTSEAGDTVTLRLREGSGEVITTVAYAHENYLSGVGILGNGISADDFHRKFDLLSVERAKPAPGTFGWATRPDGVRSYGVIDEDGDFSYIHWDGVDAELGYTPNYTDFIPDETS